MLIRLPRRHHKVGDTFYNLYMSDPHFGSALFNDAAFRKDLDWAIDHQARVFIAGDVFDGILPRDLKRFNPSVLAKELRGSDTPLDDAVAYAATKLMPAVNLLDMIGVGNHDASLIKHHGSDPVSRLIAVLNRYRTTGNKIAHGAYTGAIVQTFRRGGGGGVNWNTVYHHGYGGESSENKGILNLGRLARSWNNADVVWMGHKHHRFAVHDVVKCVPGRGNAIKLRDRYLIMSGSYRNDPTAYQLDCNGRYKIHYEIQEGHIPKPLGGVRMKLTMTHRAEVSAEVLL